LFIFLVFFFFRSTLSGAARKTTTANQKRKQRTRLNPSPGSMRIGPATLAKPLSITMPSPVHERFSTSLGSSSASAAADADSPISRRR
jgi:hypothetical protein